MYDYEIDFEPSQADEILAEAAAKLLEAAKNDVARKIAEATRRNERLEKENIELRKKIAKIDSRERELNQREVDLEKMAKRMPVEKFFGQRAVIMYKAQYTRQEMFPKCDLCDDNRDRHYKTPLGKDAREKCTCAEKFTVWEPQEMVLTELSRRDGGKLLMWFKSHKDVDAYSSGQVVYDEDVFNGQPFSKLDKGTYFVNADDCQAFCKYLNEK